VGELDFWRKVVAAALGELLSYTVRERLPKQYWTSGGNIVAPKQPCHKRRRLESPKSLQVSPEPVHLERLARKASASMSQTQCGQIRVDLAKCILASPCFLEHPTRETDPPAALQDCLKRTDELPEACQFQRKALFECKRALVCLNCEMGHGLTVWTARYEEAVPRHPQLEQGACFTIRESSSRREALI
jgi:hypothetical protein